MSVKKRGNQWWIDVVVRNGGQKFRDKRSARVKTKAEAIQVEAKARAKLMAQSQVTGKPPFFVDFAQDFLSIYVRANNKPSEQSAKEGIFKNHLVPAFGPLRLDEIGAQQIEKYKSDTRVEVLMDKGGKAGATVTAKSVNNHLIALAKLFAVAKEWKRLSDPPKVKLIKVDLPPFDFLSFEEATRLLAAKDGAWSTMALMGLVAGLRIGEMIALKWSDVNLVGGKILVRQNVWRGSIDGEVKSHVGSPKGGKAKEVPIAAPLRLALSSLPSRFAGELVFPNEGGKMYKREETTRPIKRLCKLAGIRAVGWHVLRHTFASHLAMKGVPLKAIQELMRHETITMTLRYAHLSPGTGATAIEGLYGSPTPAGLLKEKQQ